MSPEMPTPAAHDNHTPPTLSIVVPVYNGSATIPELVSALAGLEVDGGYEIVLVDDGSPDSSAEVCRALVDETGSVPVIFVALSRNYGEHNAVMAGLAQTTGDFVITMDDDLQNPPSEVLKLLNACREGGHDVVYTYYPRKKHSLFRNIGSRFANFTADLLLDKPKHLYVSSFRCMNRHVVDNLLAYDGPFPYVDGLIMQVTQRLGAIEVVHLPRAVGRSGYTLRRLVRLWMSICINFSVVPLRLSSLMGLLLTMVGFIVLVVFLVDWLVEKQPQGWLSIIGTVILFSGAQLVMLGVMGEYVGRIFLSANRKPQYVVRNVIRRTP